MLVNHLWPVLEVSVDQTRCASEMVEDLSRRKVIKKVDGNDDEDEDNEDDNNNVDSCMTLARKEKRDGTETIFF